ncbi:cytochrome P450 [Gloeophyllum trabeum ATCC 11539]|uniref:Cytochrome P450 n=1 Tax=Gloeophyllum trabeum (strain ATCC 11539 / FP-39264 / Madison 617) TaxID=670483 RepID=S7PY03_GLOTA|nr:cytochrome P450 [Gloeophyllum trabeum ATCC 11539]EPQ52491.1 cytochrome P450 [Gloeophyllum trabeum ATCC 11539]
METFVLPPLPPRLNPFTHTLSSNELSLFAVAASLGVLTLVYALRKFFTRSNLKPVPGPPGVPILGNLFDWPSEYQAETVQEWKKVYGPMVKLGILGKRMIFLTSPTVISELFAKRSADYSDRPRLIFSQDYVGLDIMHPMTQFGADFKQQRKFMKEVLHADVIRKHEDLLNEEGRRLLQGMWDTPKNFDRHLRRFSSSLSLRLVYGFEAMDNDDPHVLLAEEMMQTAEYAVIAGWAVDFIPWLRYLPAWLPGVGWKKRGAYIRSKVDAMISGNYDEVMQKVKSGVPLRDSFVTINMRLAKEGKSTYDEQMIKTTATAIYGGASDTTASAGWSLILAMLINQDAQRKAQEEIDRVTGRQRLPRMADKASLPYLQAVVWEVFRWAPPVPVTLPHRARYGGEIDGYEIKKDDTLIANLYSISRDEEYHTDPETYDPDRYLDGGEERTPYYVFGYGHRRCPGADMAFAQLFHQAAYVLSVFDIRPEVDSKGNAMYPKPEFVGEMVRHPKPFKCVITPRWENADLLFQEDVKA